MLVPSVYELLFGVPGCPATYFSVSFCVPLQESKLEVAALMMRERLPCGTVLAEESDVKVLSRSVSRMDAALGMLSAEAHK